MRPMQKLQHNRQQLRTKSNRDIVGRSYELGEIAVQAKVTVNGYEKKEYKIQEDSSANPPFIRKE